jgi:CheY-like chemotaxis protein
MDLGLPEVDGWEATRRLKAITSTRTIPVIVLTAHALKEDPARAIEAGCDHFETDPVMFDRLLRKTIDPKAMA